MGKSGDLTLMAVHAHPDDEASSTGGVLARYSAEGIQTVVVTCTNGELGDAPGGVKPEDEGFDEELVVATRLAELEASCALLGVSASERLGFHDSGMMGWPTNDNPACFWQTPVDEAAKPLIALIERYRPDVLVTYDANGFYGHPDHIQAHRITLAAAEATGIASKLYFPTFPRSGMGRFVEAVRAAGVEWDEPNPGDEFGTADEDVTAWIDCSHVVSKKRAALGAHASQTDSTFFMQIPEMVFNEVFGTEAFVRHLDRTGAPAPESDLFAGLR